MKIPIHVVDHNGDGLDTHHAVFLASGNLEGVAGKILDENLRSIDPAWGTDGCDIDLLFLRPSAWLGKTYPVRVYRKDGSKYWTVDFINAGGGGNAKPLEQTKMEALKAKMAAARNERAAQEGLGF